MNTKEAISKTPKEVFLQELLNLGIHIFTIQVLGK